MPAACKTHARPNQDLWVTVFFARRANRATMQHLRTAINGAKTILCNCCTNIKFDFNWTLIPNAAAIESASLHQRPAGDASGIFDVPEPMESIGEGQLVAGARGIPMLVVDEVRGTGGGTTILGGQDDQGRDFDVEYSGSSMFFIAVNQPNPNGNCNHIAHEICHITGAFATMWPSAALQPALTIMCLRPIATQYAVSPDNVGALLRNTVGCRFSVKNPLTAIF